MKNRQNSMVVKIIFSYFSILMGVTSVFCQTPNYFVFDLNQSQRFGAENIITTQELLHSGLRTFIPNKISDESTILKKSIGIGFRLAKLALLESQIDYLFMIAQHEAFGHGSRFREFGYSRISYNLNFPPPFGNGSGFTSGRRPTGRIISPTEESIILISGSNANTLLSELITQLQLFNGNFHYRKAQLYLFSKNNLASYIWVDRFTRRGTFGGGDIADYVSGINSQNPLSEKKYTLEKLSIQSLISLINPIQLYSTLGIGNYLLSGNEILTRIPMIRIRNIRYLPALGYNLTPFGSEYVLYQYFIFEKSFIQFSINIGDNTFYNFGSVDLKILNLMNTENFQLSSNIKLWQQPEFDIGGTTTNHIERSLGVLVSMDMAYFPLKEAKNLGIFTQLGYKTKGYVIGEKLNDGLIFRFGIALGLKE